MSKESAELALPPHWWQHFGELTPLLTGYSTREKGPWTLPGQDRRAGPGGGDCEEPALRLQADRVSWSCHSSARL